MEYDFSKIKVDGKTLDDAILDIMNEETTYKKINPVLANKGEVLRAINTYNIEKMREISDFFYKTSGIYNRAIRYMAFMYKYDYIITPHLKKETTTKNQQSDILKIFNKGNDLLETFNPKKTFNNISLKVLIYGAYYGYKVVCSDGSVVLQELPPNYCRTRYYYGNKPTVEFNMRYFDEQFHSTQQREQIFKMFPKEFKKGYKLYKQGKLKPEYPTDKYGWYLLDVNNTVKFTANGYDYPMFISAIPLILDLDEAQALDRRRTIQRLTKIIIQKMPIDKNGELIFDVDEANQLHINAKRMLAQSLGVEVLTTYADIDVEDLTDSNVSTAQTDDLSRVERQIYNNMGISQYQFNTDSNLALEKSITNDAASMKDLVLQFEELLNDIISTVSTKKIDLKVKILDTTIYNYLELSTKYKELSTLGIGKLLSPISLGHTQSEILDMSKFENDILEINDLLIPLMSSNTMSGKDAGIGDKGGRPEKETKSDKTIANQEAQ